MRLKSISKSRRNGLLSCMAAAALAGVCCAEPYKPRLLPAGYSVETIAVPKGEQGHELQFGVGGIDFSKDGTAFIASRVEGIWKYRDGKWSRFSDHLHDPQGIVVLDQNRVVVAQKPELTLVADTDGDGIADLYRTLCDAWRASGNYCEYVHGPVRDSKGDYHVTINLADGARDPGSWKGGGAAMATSGGYDGWYCKITSDGRFVPLSPGLRSPAGIGINHETDDVFFTDNQGGWLGSSKLNHARQGQFYGYPASLIDHADYRSDTKRISQTVFTKILTPPVLWIPHGEMANSPGNPIFNKTKGKFGPFEGQVFIGDQTRSNIMRCSIEKIRGAYQGAIFNFIDHLQSGCIRVAFDPKGRLWVGQTGRGWGSRGGKLYGVQRIRWDGSTIPFEIHSINLTRTGFKLTFTRPVDKASLRDGRIAVSSWTYKYHGKYGSPKVGLTSHAVKIETVADDGKSVHISTPLQTGKVYMIKLTDVVAADGSRMSTPRGYYTLNNLLED
ncbi:MAG: PQQ-dependent sugar dehydrogenase [Planctomycetota bacterium]|nr:PQQ-dependent sugar dehydrogenase [Planctomycetota bacterium]